MTPSTVQHIEIARTEMNRAVWGFLNAILPDTYHDDDVDAARDKFIAAGLNAVTSNEESEADNWREAFNNMLAIVFEQHDTILGLYEQSAPVDDKDVRGSGNA